LLFKEKSFLSLTYLNYYDPIDWPFEIFDPDMTDAPRLLFPL